jgi:hypothetical protein
MQCFWGCKDRKALADKYNVDDGLEGNCSPAAPAPFDARSSSASDLPLQAARPA